MRQFVAELFAGKDYGSVVFFTTESIGNTYGLVEFGFGYRNDGVIEQVRGMVD